MQNICGQAGRKQIEEGASKKRNIETQVLEVLKKVYYNNKCPALTYVQRGTFLEMDTSAVKSDKVLKNKIRA